MECPETWSSRGSGLGTLKRFPAWPPTNCTAVVTGWWTIMSMDYVQSMRSINSTPLFLMSWLVSLTRSTSTASIEGKITTGTVVVKGNIRQFTPTSVIFEDGFELKNVDEVIMSTGYWFDFPHLDGGRLIPVHENRCKLYKKMFPLESADKNTLAVIGLLQVESLTVLLIVFSLWVQLWHLPKCKLVSFSPSKVENVSCRRPTKWDTKLMLWRRYAWNATLTVQDTPSKYEFKCCKQGSGSGRLHSIHVGVGKNDWSLSKTTGLPILRLSTVCEAGVWTRPSIRLPTQRSSSIETCPSIHHGMWRQTHQSYS